MHKIKKYLITFSLLITLSVIILASCTVHDAKSSALRVFSSNYKINVPSSVELVYGVYDTGFTDGVYYYVFKTTDEQNSVTDDGNTIEYIEVNDEIIENYGKVISLLENDGFDDEYAIIWEHNLICYKKPDTATPYSTDFILLIYDSDLSYLYILETN